MKQEVSLSQLIQDKKFCKFCGCEHPLTDEWWHLRKSGNGHQCKIRAKHYRITHRDKIAEQKKTYCSSIKDRKREYDQNYYLKNKERRIELNASWMEKNKERLKEVRRTYHVTHRLERHKRVKFRRKNDIQCKLAFNLRCRLKRAIKRNQKSGSAIRDLGCTLIELQQHLEIQFKIGMTWDNYGDWHIDHIVPLSSFDLTDREQFLKACHYTNLQPLWAAENLRKSNKRG